MIPKAFQSNPSKRYKVKSVYNYDGSPDFINVDIYVSPHDFFHVNFKDLFKDYKLPHVNSDNVVDKWNSNPMQFYQNQLNFVVWCTTTGCGVSYEHFDHENKLIRNFYRFHVYYQARKLLTIMSCPAPFENYWKALENNIDMSAYKDICQQFHVSALSMWRQHQDNYSNGLGTAYYYKNGYIPVPGKNYDNSNLNIPYDSRNDYSSATKMGFGKKHYSTFTVAYLAQSDEVKKAWNGFILDQGLAEGFTDIGIERINDSIRTYVYALLGAQAQTKTGILTVGTGLDAQRQFLNIVENCINSPVDLQSSIDRYQDTLKYARSSLNFVLGENLYLIPSDMNLRIGNYIGYNNNILLADENTQSLGSNEDINADQPLPQDEPHVQDEPVPQDEPKVQDEPQVPTSTRPLQLTSDTPTTTDPPDSHEDEKIALVVGGVAIMGITYLTYKVLT